MFIVHMGPHKTGSTYIQNTIRQNRADLSRNWNIFLPNSKPLTPVVRSAMQTHRYRLDADKQAEAQVRFAEAAAAFFSRRAGRKRPILISHELLAGFMTGRHGDWAVFPEIGNIARVLLEAASPHDVQFVVYRRDFPGWIKSSYNQTVKTDRYTGTFETFSSSILPGETIDNCIERLSTTVGSDRVHVFDMEAEIAGGQRLGTGLFRLLGLTDDDIAALKPAVRTNESLNSGSLEFVRQVNEIRLDRETRIALLKVVKSNQALFSG